MLLALDPVNLLVTALFRLVESTHGPWMIFVILDRYAVLVVSVDVDPLAVVVRCTVFVWKNRDIYDPTAFCDYEKQTLT